MSASAVPITAALTDQRLFGRVLGPPETWRAWLSVLAGAYGLPLTPDQLATFRELTGGRDPPSSRPSEIWISAGRRSGKSRITGAIAAYTAVLAGAHTKLSPGEVGRVMVLAPSVAQAATVHGYARAFIEESPSLKRQIVDVRADEIELRGRIVISVHSAQARLVRGRTALAVILDEIGHFKPEQAGQLSDIEVIRAITPTLLTTNGPLIAISSPHMKQGVLYERFQRYYGKSDPDVLIVKGSSLRLNPTLTPKAIERALQDDPYGSISEYEAEFRVDRTGYIDIDVVRLCVDAGVTRRAFNIDHRYYAFADMSGGVTDSATLSIAHRQGERTVIDCVIECKGPHVPQDVVAEFATALREFKVQSVHGDQYAKQWVVGEFRRHGISYVHFDQNRSEIYLNALPLLQGGLAVLPDNKKLIAQLAGLERSPQRSGRDVVDHGRGGHDDVANAVCGVIVLASRVRGSIAAWSTDRARELPSRCNLGYSNVKATHAKWGGGSAYGGVTHQPPLRRSATSGPIEATSLADHAMSKHGGRR